MTNEHYRRVRYAGPLNDFFNVFDNVQQSEPEVYNCEFKGRAVLISLYEEEESLYDNDEKPFRLTLNPNSPRRARVFADTKDEAENLSKRIETASAQKFRRQAR